MKPNELRIGNLVTEQQGRIFEIISIGKQELNGGGCASVIVVGDTNVVQFIDNDFNKLKPIPLTEEILRTQIKNISIQDIGYGNTLYEIGRLQITFYKKEGIIQRADILFGEENIYMFEWFLHSLQNLYFALTNEELEIK